MGGRRREGEGGLDYFILCIYSKAGFGLHFYTLKKDISVI